MIFNFELRFLDAPMLTLIKHYNYNYNLVKKKLYMCFHFHVHFVF